MKLNPVPNPEWQAQYDKLMQDPYLAKKYNRERRISDHKKYINNCTPEIKRCTGKNVLEIGPAMGEWLELCREYGHNVFGIDAVVTDNEMGNEYAQMSKLMTERQGIQVLYIGFDQYLQMDLEYRQGVIPNFTVFYINLRGCIEQVFKQHMTGPPHKQTKDCSQLAWNETRETWDAFYSMFEEFDRILEDGGYIYSWANGSKNNPVYDNYMLETIKKFPNLHLFKKVGKLQHKIRRMM